jgi:phosphate acetyltransferase
VITLVIGYYLGALQANESANYPAISGIVLTGNIVPDDSILLIEG